MIVPGTRRAGGVRAGAAPAPLSAPEMAFVRSWAEGLDVVAAGLRYLPGLGDSRRVRSELNRLLDRLRALARAQNRPDLAALLRRDPEAMPDRASAAPSLEDFAALQPPDFYSEAELVELYEQQHGRVDARSTARRRQRLRERLLAALQTLEATGPRAPAAGDATDQWLDERVARRLAAVGIRTLGELVFWIRTHGFRWHRRIPRIGPEGAARLVRWLEAHEASLGALPATARLPASRIDPQLLAPPVRTGIVPLERFVAPAGLAGRPAAGCRLEAGHDVAAVKAWLAGLAPGSHTARAYRKEAERFLLWAVLERGKPLGALGADDVAAYRGFLAQPGPAWTGPRHARRQAEQWRPFEGPLSPRSCALACTVVRSLFAWLVRHRYLVANPWDVAPAAPAPSALPSAAAREAATPLRALSGEQWAWVERALALDLRVTGSDAAARRAFVVGFAYRSGLRLSELAAARAGWLRAGPGGGWWLDVPAGTSPARRVPLPAAAFTALQQAWQRRGLATDPAALDPETPLVARLDREAPLSTARLYEVLADAFARCAAHAGAEDAAAAESIREASARWLRHTHGLHAVADGVPLRELQARLGHRSPLSTSVYLAPPPAPDRQSAGAARSGG